MIIYIEYIQTLLSSASPNSFPDEPIIKKNPGIRLSNSYVIREISFTNLSLPPYHATLTIPIDCSLFIFEGLLYSV